MTVDRKTFTNRPGTTHAYEVECEHGVTKQRKTFEVHANHDNDAGWVVLLAGWNIRTINMAGKRR